MPDTETVPRRATSGAHRRLSDVAIARLAELGDTPEQRAQVLGVSRRTYYRMLSGETKTTVDTAIHVATVLGMSVNAAFEG